MATTVLKTAPAAMHIEDYLENFSYKPDVEFVDGELKERPMVGSIHGLLKAVVVHWFLNHGKEWNIKAGVGIRTRVAADADDADDGNAEPTP